MVAVCAGRTKAACDEARRFLAEPLCRWAEVGECALLSGRDDVYAKYSCGGGSHLGI